MDRKKRHLRPQLLVSGTRRDQSSRQGSRRDRTPSPKSDRTRRPLRDQPSFRRPDRTSRPCGCVQVLRGAGTVKNKDCTECASREDSVLWSSAPPAAGGPGGEGGGAPHVSTGCVLLGLSSSYKTGSSSMGSSVDLVSPSSGTELGCSTSTLSDAMALTVSASSFSDWPSRSECPLV